MECSICMDVITKRTGSTTLSCEHAFHFRCIDSWFTKQICEDIRQTCPCCRGEGMEMDRCSIMELDEDEEEDDEDEEEDEIDAESETITDTDMPDEEEMANIRWERMGDGRWMIITSHELAMEGVRNLFGPLNELELADDAREIAIRKIQSIIRGHQVRKTFDGARILRDLSRYQLPV